MVAKRKKATQRARQHRHTGCCCADHSACRRAVFCQKHVSMCWETETALVANYEACEAHSTLLQGFCDAFTPLPPRLPVPQLPRPPVGSGPPASQTYAHRSCASCMCRPGGRFEGHEVHASAFLMPCHAAAVPASATSQPNIAHAAALLPLLPLLMLMLSHDRCPVTCTLPPLLQPLEHDIAEQDVGRPSELILQLAAAVVLTVLAINISAPALLRLANLACKACNAAL